MKTASLIICLLCVAMPFTAARACALLESAVPRVGSEVIAPVSEVQLKFSMPVDAKHSEVTVTDADGHNQVLGRPLNNPTDASQLSIKTISLPPGDYKVTWKILADCGDMEPGDYSFTVVR